MTADTAERSSTSWRGRAAAGALLLGVVVALGLVARAGGPVSEPATGGEEGGGAQRTPDLPTLHLPDGMTLVRGDQNGVTLLRREQGRTDTVSVLHVPPGPKRLVRLGPSRAVLLASDGTAFLVDGRYAPPRVPELGPAEWAVPSTTPGQVWLFGQEESRWHAAETTSEGETVRTLEGYGPRPVGVTPEGPVSQNGYRTVVDQRGGELDGIPLAVQGERIAFCPYPCRLLRVRERPGAISEPFAAPAGTVFGPPTVFSPDGRYVATALRTAAVSRMEVGTAVVDTATGAVHRIAEDRHRALGQMEWAPDGSLLFIPARQGRLLAWEPQTQQLHEVDVPFRLLPWHGFTVFQDTGEDPPLQAAPAVPADLSGLLALAHRTGLELLDLATGTVTRAELPGQTGGDPPHRLIARDGRLVQWLGNGPVVADPRRRPVQWRQVIGGSWFVPAARDDRIWVAQGRMGVSPLPLVEVDLTGAVHRQAELADGRHPLLGVGGLLLVQDFAEGLVLWDPATGRDSTVLGHGSALAAHGDTLVWCLADCQQLAVWRDGREVRRVSAPEEAWFESDDAAPAPDGRLLATVVTGDNMRRHLVVVDLANGAQHQVLDHSGLDSGALLAWTPDSRHLILALDHRRLGAWSAQTRELTELPHQLPVRMEPWHGFAVVPSSD